ncbi:MAG: Bax inhibitor-1/YccA family protein [Zoogloeaceae bacterium]|jgi:modulator of FtsH protease|nr:Bax inhibitor-1/YccA family protein [Zoogloeaceae bacterium]
MSFDDRAYPSDRTSTPASDVGEAAQKVLRNTYLLLGLSMLPTVAGALVGMLTGFNLFTFGVLIGFLLYLGIAFGLMFAVSKTKDSGLGVVFLLAFTFFMGLMLTGILSAALSFSNGGSLIALAAGGTGVIFFALSGIAATTKRNFSNIGKFLFVGLTVVIVLVIANLFLHLPALSLVISGAALLVFSGYILYDVNRIVHGGETNYIMATLAIYLDIYNIFVSLLRLLMAFAGDD